MTEKNKSVFRYISQGFAIVGQAAGATIAGFGLGHLIDRFAVVTKPWGTVLMTFFGLATGFYRMYLIYVKMGDEKDE